MVFLGEHSVNVILWGQAFKAKALVGSRWKVRFLLKADLPLSQFVRFMPGADVAAP